MHGRSDRSYELIVIFFVTPVKNNEEFRSIPSALVNPGKTAKFSNDKLPLTIKT